MFGDTQPGVPIPEFFQDFNIRALEYNVCRIIGGFAGFPAAVFDVIFIFG